MTDEPLSREERAALDALPRELPPAGDLEERIVRSLRAAGRLRRPRLRWLGPAAAALMMFAAGYGAARLSEPRAAPDGRDQYLLLLYGAAPATPAEEAARLDEYSAWAREQAAAGRLVAAQRLGRTFALFGAADGAPSNPAEPSGFFLIRADAASQAEDIAAGCPHVRHGGTVVLRPAGGAEQP